MDRSPSRVLRVTDSEVIVDGRALRDGAPWDHAPAARFAGPRSLVEYDLGASLPIGSIWISADHNDTYRLEGSNDGKTYALLWEVPKGRGRGFAQRFSGPLEAEARYIRVRPLRGDDDLYAISELRVFQNALDHPPRVPRIEGHVPGRTFRSRVLGFGVALVGWLLLALPRSRWWWKLLVAGWPIMAGIQLIEASVVEWPIASREVSLVRGAVGVVAAVAVGLEAFAGRWRPSRGVVATTLGICAVTGFLAFYNLGQPQFYDHETEELTFAHYLDLRQYYTTAKYFDEIGYVGIYAADLAAYLEDAPGATLQKLGDRPMRDLQTLRMSTVTEQSGAIAAARTSFSKERWAEYKRDTGFFRASMGDHVYLETLVDMGGNATPVWLASAHLLFNVVDPSDRAFVCTGLLDAVLILAALIAIGYVFGWRTMAVCAVVFGANDFIMYGTNWGGATLRHDWMAYLAFGMCALQRERFRLAGGLSAASAMIRAFPALALVGTALPTMWWFYEFRRREGRFPSIEVIRESQRSLLNVVTGAAIAVLLLFGFSVLVLPADAWVSWIRKVGQLASGTHANHVSLRLLVSGWESAYHTLLERIPLFVSAITTMVVMVVAGARRATPVQGALLGLMLIPVIFYPANYYSHFVWLLPMLAVERRDALVPVRPADALVWMALLLMCGVQYFTVLVTDRGLHFWLASAVLFATFTTILLVWLGRDRVNAAFLREQSAGLA